MIDFWILVVILIQQVAKKLKKENNILTLFSLCKHMIEFDW